MRVLAVALSLVLIAGIFTNVATVVRGWKDFYSETYLGFNSIEDLNRFFRNNEFMVCAFNNDQWTLLNNLDKDTMFKENEFYVIAPYFYEDKDGYLHKIEKNAQIYISNIPNNVTLVITGFDKANIMVYNFGGTLKIGSYVCLKKKVENEGGMEWYEYIIPSLFIAKAVTNIVTGTLKMLDSLSPVEFCGAVDTAVTVTNANEVHVENYFVTRALSSPISVSYARKVVINNTVISPADTAKIMGTGISLNRVNNVVFEGINNVSRYNYNVYLNDVNNLNIKGMLSIDGKVIDPKTGNESKYGVGIYASNVKNTELSKMEVDMTVGEGGVFGLGVVSVTGIWNKTSHEFKAEDNVTAVAMFYRILGGFYWAYLNLSPEYGNGVVDLNQTNATFWSDMLLNNTIHREFKLEGFYNYNVTIRFANLTVLEKEDIEYWNKTGANNTTYEIYRVKLYLGGPLLSEHSTLKGTIAQGIVLKDLDVGLGVPDNGTREEDLVAIINSTATQAINVNTLIAYNYGYISEQLSIDAFVPFAWITVFFTFLIAFAFVRWAYLTIMYNETPEDIARNKQLLKQIIIGAMIIYFVLYNFGLLLGILQFPI